MEEISRSESNRIEWEIFYHDKTIFRNNDGEWDDAPHLGVMAITMYDNWIGFERDTGDFYIWTPWGTRPWACDYWGLSDYLIKIGFMTEEQRVIDFSVKKLSEVGVKFGRSIDNDKWQEILKWIKENTGLPRKSGKYPRER